MCKLDVDFVKFTDYDFLRTLRKNCKVPKLFSINENKPQKFW